MPIASTSDMLCLSGFVWDSGAMKLICDKSVFEDYVKKRPAASDLLNKPFPHYYTLGEIYGRDRATRANAGNAYDDEEEVRQEDNLNVNLGNDSTNKVSMNDFGDDISSANKSAPSQAENAHNRDTGGMYSSVKAIDESVAGMIPKLDGLINVLSTQDKEVADLLAKKMKATNMLATKPELLRVFFNMPSSMKKGYVLLLLSGDM
ncbi:hypothetical protein AB3S75_012876 [Citrus x aurantiifolia]